MDESSTGDWSTWIQGVGSKLIGSAADAKFSQPYDIQKLQLQQLGQMGYYREGMAGTFGQTGRIAGIPAGTVLLIGAAVVALIMLKD